MTEIAHYLRQHNVEIPSDILTIDEMVDELCQLK